MDAINDNPLRVGNFTSSCISALMSKDKPGTGFGKPALTYIAEKNMERRLGRALNPEGSARPLTWGKLLEKRAFDLLGMEYTLISKETLQHGEIASWAGSPDGEKKTGEDKTVIDIKCPITLKSFCQFVDCQHISEIRSKHPAGEDYYWQLVSNAILTESKYAELIIYMPFKSELQTIRDLADNYDGDQNKIAWVGFAQDEDLPYLIDGGYYNSLYKFHFEVSKQDKTFLTDRVIEASKMLLNFHK